MYIHDGRIVTVRIKTLPHCGGEYTGTEKRGNGEGPLNTGVVTQTGVEAMWGRRR